MEQPDESLRQNFELGVYLFAESAVSEPLDLFRCDELRVTREGDREELARLLNTEPVRIRERVNHRKELALGRVQHDFEKFVEAGVDVEHLFVEPLRIRAR